MKTRMLGAILTFLTARSPRLRKYAPLVPLALGALAFLKRHRAEKLAARPAHAR